MIMVEVRTRSDGRRRIKVELPKCPVCGSLPRGLKPSRHGYLSECINGHRFLELTYSIPIFGGTSAATIGHVEAERG